jgi:hypothetical protein
VNWHQLSGNVNAISILKDNLDKINWDYLSRNINAIEILESNLGKINWKQLSCNSIINILFINLKSIFNFFVLNYEDSV